MVNPWMDWNNTNTPHTPERVSTMLLPPVRGSLYVNPVPSGIGAEITVSKNSTKQTHPPYDPKPNMSHVPTK